MSMKKKLFITSLLFIILIIGAYQQKVPHKILGYYLSPSDKITNADAIVVVSGDSDRMKHAIDLYKQGLAPKLILSGAAKEGFTSNALAMHLEASAAGIPDESVIMEEKATNTFENALYTKEIVKSQGMDNIILVSSPYHQRRVYETFKGIFKGNNIKLQNSPSTYSKWSPNSWWETNRELQLTQEEALKLLWANTTGSYQ